MKIYLLDLSKIKVSQATFLKVLWPYLTPLEHSKIEQMTHPQRIAEFSFARATLRRLTQITDEFATSSNGKPYHSRLNFNISHSHQVVAIGVSSAHELGVDIEKVDPKKDLRALSQRILKSEGDLTSLSTQEFYQHWTLKESYLKCEGLKLSGNLTQHFFTHHSSGSKLPWKRTQDLTNHQFVYFEIKREDQVFALSVAVRLGLSDLSPEIDLYESEWEFEPLNFSVTKIKPFFVSVVE
jgi:phosphopantetheinyl transferase